MHLTSTITLDIDLWKQSANGEEKYTTPIADLLYNKYKLI